MTKQKADKSRPLTNRQIIFVQEYVADAKMNATKAAIAAGYSERTANEQAVRLMADERIQRAIQEEINARRERLRMDADDVLLRLMEIAQLDIRNFLSWDETGRVTFKPSSDIDGRFVKKIKGTTTRFNVHTRRDTEGNVISETAGSVENDFEFELVSQEKAMELLFRHFGLNAPIQVDETVPFAQLVAGAMEALRNVSTDDD